MSGGLRMNEATAIPAPLLDVTDLTVTFQSEAAPGMRRRPRRFAAGR
ncbi:hypothetical protein ACFQ4K_15935 [Tistrella bauzanensis]